MLESLPKAGLLASAIFTIIASIAPFSAAVATGVGRVDEARAFCSSFPHDGDRMRCHEQIRGARSFDPRALGVCRDQNLTSDQISCLAVIRNRAYFDGEIKICREKSFSSEKRKCLGLAGRDGSTFLAQESRAGVEAALSLCDGLSFSSEENDCMALVSPAPHFEAHAVRVCEKMSFARDKMECLRSIAGKRYFVTQATVCGTKSFDSDRIRCLKESGRAHTPVAGGRPMPFPPARPPIGRGPDRAPANDNDRVGQLAVEARRQLKLQNYGEVDRLLRDIAIETGRANDDRLAPPGWGGRQSRGAGFKSGVGVDTSNL